MSRRKEGVEELREDHHLPACIDELLAHDVTVHAWPIELDASKPCTGTTRRSVDTFCWSSSLFSPRGVTQSRDRKRDASDLEGRQRL